jgi:cleavage and polyadenylation specificity factor subunit 1
LQEDPFKLVILSKGRQPSAVSNADFFFGVDGQLSFIVTDEEGVLRIFDYNPRRASRTKQILPLDFKLIPFIDVDTNSGHRLLCRSEFHGQSDHHTVLTIARRKDDEGDQNMDGSAAIVAQSVLIYGE